MPRLPLSQRRGAHASCGSTLSQTQRQPSLSAAVAIARFLVGPCIVYLILFGALTYPLVGSFSTHLFTNAGDGLQNVWNLWWVNQAIMVLHTSPWFTTYLHYPSGVSLIGHTLNPFNGLVAIPLLRVLTLVQAHNVIVVFSFVMGGVGAFWLCFTFCRQYWSGIVGGALFTFSEYHFAHADGHLQLVSLEWLPVFALLWYRLLRQPSLKLSVGSALVLLLVLLCDYYYFAYSVVFAIVIACCEAWRRREYLFSIRARHARPFLLFVALASLTCGPLVLGLLALNAADPLLGSHESDVFSTDLLAAVIPGGHWRFADLTRPFWEALPGNIQESSVDVGLSVASMLALAVSRRRDSVVREAGAWWLVLIGFWIFSLGPMLRVWGVPLPHVPTPYRELQKVVPALALSGVPARMMVMVTLAAAVLSSVALSRLARESARGRIVAAILVVLMTVEYLPGPIPLTSPTAPGYVAVVQGIGGPGGLLDLVSGYSPDQPFGSTSGTGVAMYYQTLHERPMASGYIARLPSSAWQRLLEIHDLVDQSAFGTLCRSFDLRYLVVVSDDGVRSALVSAPLLFHDAVANADLFDLAPDGRCVSP
jgi:hypothetical protein